MTSPLYVALRLFGRNANSSSSASTEPEKGVAAGLHELTVWSVGREENEDAAEKEEDETGERSGSTITQNASNSLSVPLQTVLLLSVPPSLELFAFCERELIATESIRRVLTLVHPQSLQVSLLVIMASTDAARAFVHTISARAFDKMAPELCYAVQLSAIWVHETVSAVRTRDVTNSENMSVAMSATQTTHARLIPGLTELPLCPMCLERLDSAITNIIIPETVGGGSRSRALSLMLSQVRKGLHAYLC